ncbi:MAG: dihydrolipoyllysine-residue succinyltransferase [Rhabdochlamydiaceae bacterium]|nr:dihydrolipoyllysine-residue succinyltransferase [Candidatus Amphrikana amoebophyrae]
MSVEIKVPEFGESITEGVVVNFVKKSGEYVEAGEDLIELETDKVNSVLPSPASGVVSYSVNLEDTVSVGQVIGSIDSDAQPIKQQEVKSEVIEPVVEEKKPQSSAKAIYSKESFISSLNESQSPVSPQAEPAKAEQKASVSGGNRKPMSSLRKTIAKHLVKVKNETAMLTTFNEVDMSEVMRIRSKEKDAFIEKHGVKLGFMSFFIKACASALKEFPEVGAAIDGDDIVYPDNLGIGIAVSTEKGLVVPVLHGCESLSFSEVERNLAEYAKAARANKIKISDLKGGCFTITNGGVFGSLVSTPIINSGQSAILGMHAIQKRPIAVDDEVVIRPMMYLALSYDHRIVDGKQAIGFLVHIKENLEEPSRLLLDF